VEAVQTLGGRYRLVELLGRGGMSAVWRAHDEVLGRSVAVKVMGARHAADPTRRARLRAEAQAVACLSHPYITGVHDYGESPTVSGERVPYLVMELVRGPTLAQRLKAGSLPARAAMRICAQVAIALAAAHARGLVHRDVKPGNVILTPAGPKVVDFGIAAAAGERGEPGSNGEIWGTPAYVAPERLAGGRVSPAADVYALGLVLYRALAGSVPWPAATAVELLYAHQYEEPAPLPPIAGVPAEVRALCHRCLAKDPRRRPTAREVAAVLARASGLPLEPGGAPRPVPRHSWLATAVLASCGPRAARRRAARLVLSAAVVLVMGAFAGSCGSAVQPGWHAGVPVATVPAP
jgi:eukaryotic-like serine/threonine-protein kinase